jgi:ABC-type nickel/cobalt efflux system permease component RcnA
VALTLSGVALATVFFRTGIERLLATRRELLIGASKTLEAVAGVILVAVALHEVFIR